MAKYRIQGPDGATYEINAPDSATQDEVLAFAQQHFGQQANPDAELNIDPTTGLDKFGRTAEQRHAILNKANALGAEAQAQNPTEGMSGAQKFAAGAGKSVVDSGRGLRELSVGLGAMLPGSIGDAYKAEYDRLKAEQAAANTEDAPLLHTGAGLTGDIAGYVGQAVAPGGVLKAAGALADTAGAARAAEGLNAAAKAFSPTTVRGAATLGAAAGATQPLATGEGEGTRLLNTAVGAGAGTAGHFIPGAVKAAASKVGQVAAKGAAKLFGDVDPEAAALAQRAKELGIDITAPQLSSSRMAKVLDSISAKVPFSGARAVAEKQQVQINRAVAKTIGADADKITPDVFDKAWFRASNEFRRLAGNNDMRLTPDVMMKLLAVEKDAGAYYGNEVQGMVRSIIDRIVQQGGSGVLPGRAFSSIDSAIGRAVRSGGEKSVPLGAIQDVLRDAMERSLSAEDQGAWRAARVKWRNLKTLEPIIAKSQDGNIPPAALMGRVTANKAGKSAMARGRGGELGDLARIGQRFLKDQIPNSGTPERLLGYGALGAGGLLAPFKVAPLVAGARGTQSVLSSPAVVDAMLGGQGTSIPLKQLMQTRVGGPLSLLGLGSALALRPRQNAADRAR